MFQLVGDGGGKAPRWAARFAGAEKVARVLAALVRPFVRIGGVVAPHEVNGQPGAVFRDRDGKVVNTWALDILDGRIQTIRTVTNPDELGHMGPVADAWALLCETNQARRPTDRPHGRVGGSPARSIVRRAEPVGHASAALRARKAAALTRFWHAVEQNLRVPLRETSM